jgi:hypothetical protein
LWDWDSHEICWWFWFSLLCLNKFPYIHFPSLCPMLQIILAWSFYSLRFSLA